MTQQWTGNDSLLMCVNFLYQISADYGGSKPCHLSQFKAEEKLELIPRPDMGNFSHQERTVEPAPLAPSEGYPQLCTQESASLLFCCCLFFPRLHPFWWTPSSSKQQLLSSLNFILCFNVIFNAEEKLKSKKKKSHNVEFFPRQSSVSELVINVPRHFCKDYKSAFLS